MKALRIVLLAVVCLIATAAVAQDLVENVTSELGSAEWIWSPAHNKNEIPIGDCYFRKTFELADPDVGEVQITADNEFELFVNGQAVGKGNDWRQLNVFEISQHLVRGLNSVAIRVRNTDVGTAGLVGRVLVREKGGTYVNHATNASWKTSVRAYKEWATAGFPDQEWVAATSYGVLGLALPWGNEVVIAGVGARFNIPKDFVIERLMRDNEVGSLIAMAFDAQGNILASREGGNLMLITDGDDNGAPDSVSVFCDQIINVQGIQPLGTRVFVIGDGPAGEALYRLRDADRDGVAEEVTALVPIRGSKGEHGAHAVRLGPDGLLYVIVGDHARVGKQPGPHSPYRNSYEGDIIQPRFDDPRGHAVGIPAPGGTIFRTDVEGKMVELVAGGMRNSYDFGISPDGEIFTYDSDMEWDMGAPWYRPTRVNHATEGAELGWRSGWAKWPEYYLDSLPATLDLGAGSPTGVEFYDHKVFPEQYHGAMFGCDWATGRIYSIRLERMGATYRAKSEVFVAGRPLNVTDGTVGPDGAFYFCTGGRGTDGGIYRVRWTGATPLAKNETGVELAIHQPQIDADWARTQIVGVMNSLGDQWEPQLTRVATDALRSSRDRRRALDLLMFFGPRPSDALLLQLTHDPHPEVRAKATRLMFASSGTACTERLGQLLSDPDPLVRRVACETFMRQGSPAPMGTLVKLLGDSDRFVAFAARRALEQQPPQAWARQVIDDPNGTIFCRGAVALLAVTRDANVALAVLKRCETILKDPAANDDQLVDALRVSQLAIALGKLPMEQVPTLGPTLLARYPTGTTAADRELVRLLVYLQVPGAAEKFAAQMTSELPYADKLHVAAYASRLEAGWNIQAKIAVMKFFEESRTVQGGYSVSAYVENFARDFFTKFSLAERQQVLAQGERWPTSALSVLAKLPPQPPAELLDVLRDLDGRVQPRCAASDDYRRLRVGILAVLGRSGDPQSCEYLRVIYASEPSARPTVAMSLTQSPSGENWPILVDSLKTVDGRVAQEVLSSLARVPQHPQEPEAFRQVIMQGLRLGDEGASLALALLDHWAGRQPGANYDDWQAQLTAWQQWYATNFPAVPPAQLPHDVAGDKWSYEELLAYLESDTARAADPQAGRLAFGEAQCAKCHRFGPTGETLGPDLTAIARRFQRREILESIVYPSHNISDQYASKIVMSNGRTFSGLIVPQSNGDVTVLLATGEKVELAKDEIDEIKPTNTSVMPTGLLNALTLEQVGQLFAYLEKGGEMTELARQPGAAAR